MTHIAELRERLLERLALLPEQITTRVKNALRRNIHLCAETFVYLLKIQQLDHENSHLLRTRFLLPRATTRRTIILIYYPPPVPGCQSPILGFFVPTSSPRPTLPPEPPIPHPRNRLHPLSAPRSTQTRGGQTPNSVRPHLFLPPRLSPPATKIKVSPHRVWGKREPDTTRSRFGDPPFWVQNLPAFDPDFGYFRYIPYSIKPLSRKRRESPDENSSTYAKPPRSLPKKSPQPSLPGVRTAIGVSPVRVWVDRGAETPQTRLRGSFEG